MKSKWLLVLICLGLTATLLCGCEGSVSDYFEQNWLDKLISYAAVLLGAVTAISVTIAKVRSGYKILTEGIDKVDAKGEGLRLSQEALAKAQKLYEEECAKLLDEIRQLQASRAEQAVALDEIKRQLDSLKRQLDSLKRGMSLALVNDPDLVERGTARQIAIEWEVGDETQI